MYHVGQEEKMWGVINAIASEEIDETPYNIIQNPKPVVESVMLFDDAKVDLGKWSAGNGVDTNSKKVGKAKTAPTKSVAKVTEQDTVNDKKSGGKVVELDTKVPTKVSKAPKAGNGGSFNAAANSAKSDNQSGASKNKHFEQKQRKLNELFRNHVKSLMVDEKTTKDCEKILKKFDEITSHVKKSLTESIANYPEINDIKPEYVYAIEAELKKQGMDDDEFWIDHTSEFRDIYDRCLNDVTGLFDETLIPGAVEAVKSEIGRDAACLYPPNEELETETEPENIGVSV